MSAPGAIAAAPSLASQVELTAQATKDQTRRARKRQADAAVSKATQLSRQRVTLIAL